jgi:hypothetical protein
MLNCGFRSADLNSLRREDVHLKVGRIVIQREKMNQNETSPVVNYPLWPITVKLIRDAMADDPVYVFAGRNGNRLIVEKFIGEEPRTHDNLSRYWGKKRAGFGLAEKRLDYIRKTRSTENREPSFHISSPIEGWDGPHPERHHDFIDRKYFPKCWHGLDVTVEVEAKAKEVAVRKLMQQLRKPEQRTKHQPVKRTR